MPIELDRRNIQFYILFFKNYKFSLPCGGRLVHWIDYTPLLAQAIHDAHDLEGFLVWHAWTVQTSVAQCITTSDDLILISGDLLRAVDVMNAYAIGIEYLSALRIVDVVHLDVSLFTAEDAMFVIVATGRCLHVGHDAIAVDYRDAVVQIHAGRVLYALRLDGLPIAA